MNSAIAKEMLKELLKSNNMTLKQAVEQFNAVNAEDSTSVQNVTNKLAKGTIRYCEVVELLEANGFEITIKRKGAPEPVETTDEQDDYIQRLVTQEKAVYVHCKDDETARRFLNDCEIDGILFDDGKNPTEKDTADLFRLLPNKRMCYVGAIGHIRWQANQDDIMRIEY